jgi:hypothetical protein
MSRSSWTTHQRTWIAWQKIILPARSSLLRVCRKGPGSLCIVENPALRISEFKFYSYYTPQNSRLHTAVGIPCLCRHVYLVQKFCGSLLALLNIQVQLYPVFFCNWIVLIVAVECCSCFEFGMGFSWVCSFLADKYCYRYNRPRPLPHIFQIIIPKYIRHCETCSFETASVNQDALLVSWK